MFRLTLAAALLMPSFAIAQGELPKVSAPITYEKTMLVLVNEDGAAAVRFRGTGGGAATYDYRYESNDGRSIVENNKPLIEVRGPKGIGGELFIKTGPMLIEWSKGGADAGWVYYRPEEVSVFLANDEYFLDRPSRHGDPVIPKLDLKRFMRK